MMISGGRSAPFHPITTVIGNVLLFLLRFVTSSLYYKLFHFITNSDWKHQLATWHLHLKKGYYADHITDSRLPWTIVLLIRSLVYHPLKIPITNTLTVLYADLLFIILSKYKRPNTITDTKYNTKYTCAIMLITCFPSSLSL